MKLALSVQDGGSRAAQTFPLLNHLKSARGAPIIFSPSAKLGLSMKFKKPPLIELVADFRWNPIGSSAPFVAVQQNVGQLVPQPLADPARNESFFSSFADGISKQGYVKAERLVPIGWPFPGQFPVMRFRHPQNEGPDLSTLYQVGAGLFSAHALPPYDNWEQFKPVIHRGLEVLLSSRPTEEQTAKFSVITLRYIDRFSTALTGNLQPRTFIEEVLNIHLDLPKVVQDETEDQSKINPTIILKLPLKSGLQMNLAVNNSNDPPSAGFVMDTTVVTLGPTDSSIEAAMRVLETAHDSIRRVFVGLTEPIASRMEPDHVTIH